MTKKVQLETFFFIFAKNFFFSKIDNIFLPNEKRCGKKNNCDRLTGHNYGHLLDRKLDRKLFFCEQPESRIRLSERLSSLASTWSRV